MAITLPCPSSPPGVTQRLQASVGRLSRVHRGYNRIRSNQNGDQKMSDVDASDTAPPRSYNNGLCSPDDIHFSNESKKRDIRGHIRIPRVQMLFSSSREPTWPIPRSTRPSSCSRYRRHRRRHRRLPLRLSRYREIR